MIRSQSLLGAARRAVWLGVPMLAVVLRPPLTDAQSVFTWTDNGGVVHFSDSPPPPGQKYEQRGTGPIAPVVKHPESEAAGDTAAGGGAPAPTAVRADTENKEPARVIVTSKESSPRGLETRHVIGSVKNVGGRAALRVGVTLRIVDSGGGECGSEQLEATPATLGPGEIGVFDGTFDNPCFAEDGSIDTEAHWD